jgi:hypothetical protein
VTDFFAEALSAASGDEFDEIPVSIKTFVESPDFLSSKQPRRLSAIQYQLVEAMTQIFKLPTLIRLYGEEEGVRRYKTTCREIIMQLGKGSGKDFTSTIAVAYVVYLCLCLKSPTRYFNNDSIDIINVAINADQAQRVFFKNFMQRIKECPWFEGKYNDGRDNVEFDKNIFVYSGHSERESYEGYNTLIIILDEISGFALENTTGNQKAKTGDEIYKWARGSVDSRFSELGKVVCLSFPRFKDDWIQQRYNRVVAEKETIKRQATLKINTALPDGTPGNEFDIEWDEDHIIRYRLPGVFALRRPSWDVNPNKDLQKDYGIAFYENMGDALGRFACMPSNLTDGFFKNMEAVREAFVLRNGVTEYGTFRDDFLPEPGIEYYVHVDLAQKHDHCAVAMAHVEKWISVEVGSSEYQVVHPFIKVDAIRYWTPTKENTIDFADVRNFIIALRDRGFNLKLVTFDRWNSHDTMKILTGQHGIETETLSVAKKHYDDFLSVVYGKRLVGPYVELLLDELGELMLIKDKVDHPAKGSKDLSDAVCGAIFNSVSLTEKPTDQYVEVRTLSDITRENAERDRLRAKAQAKPETSKDGVIRSPKRQMPEELDAYMKLIRML